MIDMAVREPDFVYGDASPLDGTLHLWQVAARIDHHSAFRQLAPQWGAVLLERGDRHDYGFGFGHGRRDGSPG